MYTLIYYVELGLFFLVKNKRVLWQHSTSFPSHLAKHLFQYILQLLIDSQNLPISVFYLGSGQRNIDIIYSWKTSIILLGSKEISIYEFINLYIYTAQNKYVCTRLFALFDVLNWSLNKKVYTILKLVQFPFQL